MPLPTATKGVAKKAAVFTTASPTPPKSLSANFWFEINEKIMKTIRIIELDFILDYNLEYFLTDFSNIKKSLVQKRELN